MKIQILIERHNEQAIEIMNLQNRVKELEGLLANYKDNDDYDLPTLKSTKSNPSFGKFIWK